LTSRRSACERRPRDHPTRAEESPCRLPL
jgi:hypothetical protein